MPVVVHDRIERRTLSLETIPAAETEARRVVIAHVPFAEKRGLVPGFLQLLWKGFQSMALLASLGVVNDSMRVRILAGQNARSTRRAKRRRRKSIEKLSAFTRDAI